LSETELAAALGGLGPAERAELLRLLEMREQAEAALPADMRRPISDFADEALREAAERSGDPDEYLAIHAAHRERRDAHFAQLLARRRPSLPDDLDAYLSLWESLSPEAGELAAAEGLPEPLRRFSVASAPATDPTRERPTLPPPVRPDVDNAAAMGALVGHAMTAGLQHEDKLAHYRGRPITETPLFDDGC
jgi:hypothetical protein